MSTQQRAAQQQQTLLKVAVGTQMNARPALAAEHLVAQKSDRQRQWGNMASLETHDKTNHTAVTAVAETTVAFERQGATRPSLRAT